VRRREGRGRREKEYEKEYLNQRVLAHLVRILAVRGTTAKSFPVS